MVISDDRLREDHYHLRCSCDVEFTKLNGRVIEKILAELPSERVASPPPRDLGGPSLHFPPEEVFPAFQADFIEFEREQISPRYFVKRPKLLRSADPVERKELKCYAESEVLFFETLLPHDEHPHIVKCRGCWVINGWVAGLVLERLPTSQYLECSDTETPLDVESVIGQVRAALEHLHTNLYVCDSDGNKVQVPYCHKDVNVHSIMLTKDGERDVGLNMVAAVTYSYAATSCFPACRVPASRLRIFCRGGQPSRPWRSPWRSSWPHGASAVDGDTGFLTVRLPSASRTMRLRCSAIGLPSDHSETGPRRVGVYATQPPYRGHPTAPGAPLAAAHAAPHATDDPPRPPPWTGGGSVDRGPPAHAPARWLPVAWGLGVGGGSGAQGSELGARGSELEARGGGGWRRPPPRPLHAGSRPHARRPRTPRLLLRRAAGTHPAARVDRLRGDHFCLPPASWPRHARCHHPRHRRSTPPHHNPPTPPSYISSSSLPALFL